LKRDGESGREERDGLGKELEFHYKRNLRKKSSPSTSRRKEKLQRIGCSFKTGGHQLEIVRKGKVPMLKVS